MDPSLQALIARLERLGEQFNELKEGVRKAIDIAGRDPEMALTRTRKVLEYVVRDVYERRINEPPGTRPLENLLQRLVKDRLFPDRLDAYANTIRKLGNVGTHSFGEKVTAADVYQSLAQLLPILEWYLENEHPHGKSGEVPAGTAQAVITQPSGSPTEGGIAVLPKGLRSFDAGDAEFFLDLLPGPRDRDGLPESVRFWKHRVEGRDELTFSVGMIYGPSGCGKTSLVKAGLLPRLAKSVRAIYVEATDEETESRLLKGLRGEVAELPSDLGLAQSLVALRRGQFLGPGQKVLLVLDQFEQWLHARRNAENTELVQALRQCDGGRLQCIVLVRDDFWLAVSRFMQALEIQVVEGENSRLVDLFDLLHARKVLAAFGRAYGRLPDNLGHCTEEQNAFLDQAVEGLAQEGRVNSVRLALFAEMVKGRAWTPATLKEVGGMEGVGVTFLEETFTASTAPPHHRLHQKAAQAVLKALLPEAGTDIKGHMRSEQELREASGYADRPKDFDDLLRILNGETRLITPTDPEGQAGPEDAQSRVHLGQKYYQLTHDYLVPALRDWLTRKQKETRRGRAELLLADRAAVWNARPENRQLPSLFQWLTIRWWTRKPIWTPPQRRMMAKAGRYHAARGLVLLVALALVGWGGYEGHGTLKAHALRDRLLDANTNEVPGIVEDMAPYRRWVNPLLREAYSKATADKDARKQLHASLALLPVDSSQSTYLHGRLLSAEPHEVPVIRDALAPHKDELRDQLWVAIEKPDKGKEPQRLRAAAALAKYEPESERWAKASALVAEELVGESPVHLGVWMEGFRPIKAKLLQSLTNVYRDANRHESERSLATSILADYAADQPPVLADLLMDADEKQFAVIFPKFKEQGDRGLPLLTAEIDKKLPPELPSSDGKREALAKRQANAAVALLRLDQPAKVWPTLKHSPDPRVRSYLIHRLSPLGADAKAIVTQLGAESDVTIRRALILSLGEFDEQGFSAEDRKAVIPKLQEMYRTASDPGLRAAAEWLLRQWKEEQWLKLMGEEWAKDQAQREKRLAGIRTLLAKDKEKTPPQWYVNGQGQTMVVIPGPVEFVMGSHPTEAGRSDAEWQHRKRIGRTFAVAAKSVTLAQYRQFDKDYTLSRIYSYSTELPVVYINWFMAAKYCNWLSSNEGIEESQWCYEINGQVVKLKENYLKLTGFRLPTEAEMEYATRAGTVTSRYFGESDDLLPKYARYQKNSQDKLWPVGTLKPNDLGLFDVQGNVYTWCQDQSTGYPMVKSDEVTDDREDSNLNISTANRVLRGSSFYYPPSRVRSAYRVSITPADQYYIYGFRPTRTFSALIP